MAIATCTTTYVMGVKPPDENWCLMKAVWDACVAAEICDMPFEVKEYFNGRSPSEAGVEVELEHTPYQRGGDRGFEIKLEDIPKGVTVVRIYEYVR